MKLVTNKPVAQGDILIIPVSTIPANAKAAIAEGGHYIIAHSETGHHHVIDCAKAEVYEAADDAFVAYIRTLAGGAEIEHQRPFDTHETVALRPNQTYEVRRQREYVPEGFRKAAD
jgi:ketosteroid isomerase-like protein